MDYAIFLATSIDVRNRYPWSPSYFFYKDLKDPSSSNSVMSVLTRQLDGRTSWRYCEVKSLLLRGAAQEFLTYLFKKLSKWVTLVIDSFTL